MAATEESRRPRTSPIQFLREVRQEVGKVTWPTRKETGVTTAMVFVFVSVMSLFFVLADWILQHFVKYVLGLGG